MTALTELEEFLPEIDDDFVRGWLTGWIGPRANAWRVGRGLSTDPPWIATKLTEEVGELASALVGDFEQRPNRGDVVQEAAQVVIVVASLLDRVRPGVDLFAAVVAEMERLGA